MESLIVKLKGLSYREPKEIAASRLLGKKDTLILISEPDNVADPFAIKVLTRPGIFIGYVDRAYSEYISGKLAYARCSVATIKQTAIPFIDLEIKISDQPITQPEIERDPSRLTPTEKMMILDHIVVESQNMTSIPDGYYRYSFMISWTMELPRANVLRAAICHVGDPLVLRADSESRYPGRIEVLSVDGILLGYIDEDTNPGLSELISFAIKPTVASTDSIDRLQGCFYVTSEMRDKLPCFSSGFFDYPYKEVSYAQNLAKDDPQAALDLIAYAMSHEKGITAHEVALKCYWHLKDWEARRKTALIMLDRIEGMRHDEWDGFTFNLMKTRKYQELIGIIETCDKKILAAARKKR